MLLLFGPGFDVDARRPRDPVGRRRHLPRRRHAGQAATRAAPRRARGGDVAVRRGTVRGRRAGARRHAVPSRERGLHRRHGVRVRGARGARPVAPETSGLTARSVSIRAARRDDRGMATFGHARTWLRIAATLLVLAGALTLAPAALAAAPPAGVTAFASTARVELAWQPSSGATAYAVYRGTSAGAITTRISPAGGVFGTTFADSSAANGTTYFYAVRAIESGIESTSSTSVSAAPANRSCSTGNPTVLENCLPGSSNWPLRAAATVPPAGSRGTRRRRASTTAGRSDSRSTPRPATFSVEVYRMGNYGGLGGRLVSVMRGLPGSAAAGVPERRHHRPLRLRELEHRPRRSARPRRGRPACTCCASCAATRRRQPHPARGARRRAAPDVMWGSAVLHVRRPTTPTAARSLYDFNSGGANTVGGSPRAVKVSFDRPFEQSRSRQHDWFTETEQPAVAFLERQGYDMGYVAGTDLERNPGLASSAGSYVSPRARRVLSARGCAPRSSRRATAATGLLFTRRQRGLLARAVRGVAPVGRGRPRAGLLQDDAERRVADPAASTGTWRDPAGANKPENALSASMFVGQNTTGFFPMRVSAAQGQDRLWRYTGLDELADRGDRAARLGHRRLGVGRAGRQRLRAGRRQDARRLAGQRQRPAGRGRRLRARQRDVEHVEVQGGERRARRLDRHEPLLARARHQHVQRGRRGTGAAAVHRQRARRHGRAAGDAGERHRARHADRCRPAARERERRRGRHRHDRRVVGPGAGRHELLALPHAHRA